MVHCNSDSRSCPLVKIIMSVACRLLFITGGNAYVMVMSVLKKRGGGCNLLAVVTETVGLLC